MIERAVALVYRLAIERRLLIAVIHINGYINRKFSGWNLKSINPFC